MMHSNLSELILKNKIRLTRIHPDYQFKPFDCGNTDLNEFLFKDSITYLRYLRYTTTILENDDSIIAYFSLANDLLTITDIEDFSSEMEVSDIAPTFWDLFITQLNYPAAKIGRLAVDKDFQNKRIGTAIIDYLTVSFTTNNKTGCQFITVDAVNSPDVIRFYENNGFKMLTCFDCNKESRQMYKSLLEATL